MARPKSDHLLKTVLLCRICGVEKGPEAYAPSNWKKYVPSAECRDCRRTYSRDRYETIQQAMADAYRHRRAAVDMIKTSRGCVECGERHPSCLDFHHRDRTEKVLAVGSLVSRSSSMSLILAEIEKCDVLWHHWKAPRPKVTRRRRGKTDPTILTLHHSDTSAEMIQRLFPKQA